MTPIPFECFWFLYFAGNVSDKVGDLGYTIAAVMNLISTIGIAVGLCRIYKFVKSQGQWQWRKDGLITIHLVIYILLTIFEFLFILAYQAEDFEHKKKIYWLLIVYNCFNFIATTFILFLIYRFSQGQLVAKFDQYLSH